MGIFLIHITPVDMLYILIDESSLSDIAHYLQILSSDPGYIGGDDKGVCNGFTFHEWRLITV